MYILNWQIKIGNYQVRTLKEVKITTSVLNLADTATIELPGKYLNSWKSIENKINVGDAVTIALGYNNVLETEFRGYLKRIARDNNSLVLECEDALYLLNKSISNREYKDVTLKNLLADILAQVDGKLRVDCDYNFTYEKMVVFRSTAFDVLKKIHDDTKANIWFEGDTLHVHPVYQQMAGDKAVIYDTKVNIQSTNLKWVDKSDKKVVIEVKYTDEKGNIKNREFGVSGGEKVTRYVPSNRDEDLQRAAENEYNLWNYSGYEGDFTGWLLPVVKAGRSVRLRDTDRDENGTYYVTGVEIEFGQNGAKRKVSLGRKLV